MVEPPKETIHKIHIYNTYKLTKKQFSDLLTYGEFPQNETIQLNFHVKNIGQTQFSGGEIKEVRATFEGGLTGGLTSTRQINAKVPPLNPNQEVMVFNWAYKPASEGIVWIKCKITSNEKIEYYQKIEPPFSIGTEEWYAAYTVTNRTQLITIRLLTKISSQLKELIELQGVKQ